MKTSKSSAADEASEAEQNPVAAWVAQSAWAVAGALAGLIGLIVLLDYLRFTYEPFQGVVGPPALHDRSPYFDSFCYLVGMVLASAVGIAAMWVGGRFREVKPRLVVGILLLLGAVAGLVAVVYQSNTQAESLLRSFVQSPIQLLKLGIVIAVVWVLGYRGKDPEPQEEARKFHRIPLTAVDRFNRWLGRYVPPLLHILLVLAVLLPEPLIALMLGVAIAAGYEHVMSPPESYRRRARHHLSVWLEAGAWLLLGLAPLIGYYHRAALTWEWTDLGMRLRMGIGLLVVLLPLGLGIWRRRLRYRPLVRPTDLIPFTVASFMLIAAGVAAGYDPFHQGEFITPAEVLRQGGLPWRDIFIVHGLGYNTILGLLMGPPELGNYATTHSLDYLWLVVLGGLMTFCMGVFYLWLWRPRWWLTAIALSCLVVPMIGPVSGRYMPVWLVLILVVAFLRRRRLRWLTLAGFLSWGALFSTMDIGALLLVGVGLWTLVWGWRGVSLPGARSPKPIYHLFPAIAFGVGAGIAAVLSCLILLRYGLLLETVNLVRDYAAIKLHYDKLFFELNTLASLYGPAIGVLGIWASWSILRRGENSTLASCVVLLTILNFLAFLRALDRADFGHTLYGTMLAWPLAGTLVVWRTERLKDPSAIGRRVPPSRERLWRNGLLAGLVLSLPYLGPGFTHPSGAKPIIQVHRIPAWLLEFHDRVLIKDVEDPEAISFFETAGQLDEVIGDDELFYDFSNLPAYYAWLGQTPPSRFLTAYHASSEAWQQEVIESLETKGVEWVIWQGPYEYWNAPDGTPRYVFQWRIAEYLLRHFHPEQTLAGSETRFSRVEETVLLARNTAGETPPYTIGRDAWLEPVHLQNLPAVWGKHTEGIPEIPSHQIDATTATLEEGLAATIGVTTPSLVRQTVELQLTFEAPAQSTARLSWRTTSGEDADREIYFDIQEKFAGPYRIRLGSIPSWVWEADPTQLQVHFEPPLPPQVIAFKFFGKQGGSELSEDPPLD